MNDPNKSRDALEQFVDAALRGLPPRRAPDTLEARVLAELERRAALGWQSSFARWPLFVRLAFLCACAVTGTLVVRASSWFFATSSSTLTGVSSELAPAVISAKATANVFAFIAHSIPSAWLYGAASLLMLLYVALFGIGAAAYRTLYASR